MNWVMDPGTEGEREVPYSLPDWDYQMDLRLRRRLSVDVRKAREDAGLDVEAALAVSVRWNSVPSHLRGSAAWIPLAGEQDVDVDVLIPGERVGGVLQIETMIVLAGRTAVRPATARRPGSCLWSDAVEIRLQGDAPLFPLALIPFADSGLPAKAAWFLEIGADLNASALGSIQLLVNQEHPRVVAAVSRAANGNDVGRAILSVLKTDVIRNMIERALDDEAFSMKEDFGDGTLGAVLQGLLRTYLHEYTIDDDLTDLHRMRDNDASQFVAVIQSATELLGERT